MRSAAYQNVDELEMPTGAQPTSRLDQPFVSASTGAALPAVPQLRAYLVLKSPTERVHLRRALRVEVSAGDDIAVVVHAPELNMNGFGDDLDGALNDLGSTALDVWRSHRLTPAGLRDGSVVAELANLDSFLGTPA